MEMDKRKAIIIAVILLAATTIAAVAQNGEWFSFTPTPDFSGTDIELQDPLMLTSLPDSLDFFQISVIMTGTGNTDSQHWITIDIEHNRIEGGWWEATGSYVLALEMGGIQIEVIDADSFTGLRCADFPDSYVKVLPWTPTAFPSIYLIVLNLTDITWELVSLHTITATVETLGGRIESGGTTVSYGAPHDFKVLDGEPQGFNINPDAGYAIDDVLVDNSSVGPVNGYIFGEVTADHTIEAYFVPSFITMRSYQLDDTTPAYEFVDDTGGFTYQELLFNDSQTRQYITGVETVNCSLRVMFTNSPITSITYSLEYMYLNGTSPVTVFDDTISCSLNTFDMYTFINLFPAPSIPNEDYSITVHIKSVTSTP